MKRGLRLFQQMDAINFNIGRFMLMRINLAADFNLILRRNRQSPPFLGGNLILNISAAVLK